MSIKEDVPVVPVRLRFYFSGAFYFAFLQSPIQTAETDADGKFVIEIPKTGAFVIAAQAERSVGEETERYYWLQPVSLEGQSQRVQNLTNNISVFFPVNRFEVVGQCD